MRSFEPHAPARPGAPTSEEVTAYVLEMLLELTGLALTVGEERLGADISEVVGRHASAAPRPVCALEATSERLTRA